MLGSARFSRETLLLHCPVPVLRARKEAICLEDLIPVAGKPGVGNMRDESQAVDGSRASNDDFVSRAEVDVEIQHIKETLHVKMQKEIEAMRAA